MELNLKTTSLRQRKILGALVPHQRRLQFHRQIQWALGLPHTWLELGIPCKKLKIEKKEKRMKRKQWTI